MTGLETSELLVSQGNNVSVVEMADKIAPGAWFQQLDDALPKLKAANTKFYTSTKLVDILPNGITVLDLVTNNRHEIQCDKVVLSMGVKPDNAFFESLKSHFDNVYAVGDCVKTGRIFNATDAAYRLATSLK